MSGSSTPLRDNIPQGQFSLQDIFDGIVLDACQLNALLSLSEDIISSEGEVSQDGSEGKHEGE